MTSLVEHWHALVAVAALGTDRREPPEPPIGLLADLAADDRRADAAGRVLQQAAASTVVRRAGSTPLVVDASTALAPPASDAREVTSPTATALWRAVCADWPVLEDEWLATVLSSGHRLSPELVVPLLVRHRNDSVRHATVRAAAGPVADWLIDWNPRLGPTARRRIDPSLIGRLPDLAVPPEYAPLLLLDARRDAPHLLEATVRDTVHVPLLERGLTPAIRPVLSNVVARVHPSVLHRLHAVLDDVCRDPATPETSRWIVATVLELATLRVELLADLGALPTLVGAPRHHPDHVTDREAR